MQQMAQSCSRLQGSHLEQVVKVSSKKQKYNSTEEAAADGHNVTDSNWDTDPSGTASDHSESTTKEVESIEQDVDRLIDADSNEYVLSRSRGGYLLTLDPLLIQACFLQCARIVGWFIGHCNQATRAHTPCLTGQHV